MKNNPTHSVKTLLAAAACVGLLFAFLSGCQNPSGVKKDGGGDKNPPIEKPSSEKKLIEFKFEAAKNANLTEDAVGTINEDSKHIVLIVPHGTALGKFTASFTASAKAEVLVKDQVQTSGETENDFKYGVMPYVVKAEDGSQQRYVVQVEAAPAAGQKFAGNKITSFGFEKRLNPDLPVDYVKGTVSAPARAIVVTFPVGTKPETVKNLIPTFTASAKAQVNHNGKNLESTKTPSDFYHHLGTNFPSDTNKITVTAEDGGTFDYFLFVEILLPKAETAEVQKYFGSYYGETDANSPIGANKVVIVLEENKVTLYSTAMSMDYVNVKWEKNNGAYACIAYKMGKPQIKVNGKADYVLTEEGGKIMVTTSAMMVPINATKGADFVYNEEAQKAGYKPVSMHF